MQNFPCLFDLLYVVINFSLFQWINWDYLCIHPPTRNLKNISCYIKLDIISTVFNNETGVISVKTSAIYHFNEMM